MKARVLALTVSAAFALTGCGAASSGAPTGSHSSPASSHDMHAADRSGPSDSASMVCSDEIRTVVRTTLKQRDDVPARGTWRAPDYTCTYTLPGSVMTLTVHDATDATVGRRHFDQLRARLLGSTTIRGVASFGFPAFQDAAGNVVFLKDGKTLRVDASRLATRTLPAGFSRTDVAYRVAAAVIGCWTE